jgi:hypothetical protein
LQPLVNWRQQTNALIERIVGGLSAILKLSLQIGLIYAADEFSFQVARYPDAVRQ